MSDFKTQVENITETVTDTSALNDWLKNGAWDIINRIKITDPSKLQSFAQQKDISNNTASIGGNLLLGVYSSASEYREIPTSLKIKAVDNDSIHKATLTNPVYWKENGNIYLRPTGGVSNTMSVIELDTANLQHNSPLSELKYFPDDLKHLIVYFAAMQQLQYLMSVKSLPDDSTLDLSGIPVPVCPVTFTASQQLSTWDGSAQSRIIVDNTTLAAVPTYTKPVLETRVAFKDFKDGLSKTDPGIFSLDELPPIAPDISTVSVDTSGWNVPTFVSPIMDAPDWSDTNHWISTEEDPEMLAARVQEISAKASTFSALLNEAKSIFEKDNAKFQADVQKSLSDAKLLADKDSQLLNRYQAEIAEYQGRVSTKVSEYQQKLAQYSEELKTSLVAWQKEESDKIERYQTNIQDNLNEFNEENIEYQAKLQIALENARLSSAGDGILIQRFKSEVETYMAEVNSKIQEYTGKVKSRTVEYTWLQEQYMRVKSQYESGFVPFQPPKREKD
mgnify:FL=1